MGTPFQPLPCDASGGGGADAIDVENVLLCDVDAAGVRLAAVIMVQQYDVAGVPVGPPVPTDPATGLPYVVVGTLVPCTEAAVDVEQEILCDVQPDATSVQFIRHYVHNTDDGGLTGESFDTLPDGSVYVPTGAVGSCDPHRLCTPDATQDLNGDCGPGEVADPVIIGDEGVSSDSIITDDPTADALCGGVWDRPSQPSPFEVEETFRNATFDQPGPVVQGTAPYAGLTADPAFTGSNAGDTPGQGWLQASDINSGTNGIWQVPNPFSTADGMTASVTFASHDGSAQGGDGMAFVFTDGGGAAQGAPIGGFGNLGLKNWANGYVAVVLDEYGQTCSCSQGPDSGQAGGCGFCTNHISIQLAGATREGASCACCTIARADVSPKTFNSTTRGAPARLIVSIIEELGQTYVSASILWPGDTDPTVYFNRQNVTACAGPSPASLRMALYGGSGGGLRSEHEFRDAVARAAGIQDWRAFPIITDPIPACVTSVTVSACVDVTFTEDTQGVGNGDPEAFLWLVNNATGNVIDKAQISSLPSQVGNVRNICVDAVVPVADLPNLRVYVGAETRDANGAYGSNWENLEITVGGIGCPVTPIRTLAISAPCPLPVTIVGGSSDGTPAPVTVVNTPATFEDAPVCILAGGVRSSGFRREVRNADGSVVFSFLGLNGFPVVPDEWTPGPCLAGNQTLGPVCFNTVPATFARGGFLTLDINGDPVLYDFDGTVVTDPYVILECTHEEYEFAILCDTGNGGHQFQRWYVVSPIVGTSGSLYDFELDGSTVYAPVGPVELCDGCAPTVLGDVCVNSTDFPGIALPAVAVQACDGTVTYINAATGVPWPNTTGVVVCPPDNQAWEEILCDAGNAGQTFRRVYTLTPLGSALVYDEDFDTNPYAPVGPVVACAASVPDRDREVVCWTQTSTGTAVHTGTIRHDDALPAPGWLLFDQHQTLVSPAEPGLTFVPCGASAVVDRVDAESIILCDATPTRFLRTYTYDAAGVVAGFTDRTLAGAAFAPVGAVGVCTTPVATDLDFAEEILCDSAGTAFIRRFTFNSQTGAVTATVNLTLAGAAFAPVGAVGQCSDCCPQVIGEGCTNTGSGFYTAIRATNGTISLIDSVTGAAVLAANIIACPSDNTTRTLTAQARQLTNGTPWTPGADVAGTLTSLTVTGVSGLWDLVDANGTALVGLPAGLTLTWEATDDNTLTGPQSVTPQAGASVVANWTQR